MFLAWKELIHTKVKFGLIISVVLLISYLVYFLTSLAYGLASSYTNGITSWSADNIVLTSDSNDNITMSMMKNDDYNAIGADDVNKARLGLFPAVISDTSLDAPASSKVSVYVFGIDDDSFLEPKGIINVLANNEVIANSSLKDLGYKKGDRVHITGTEFYWSIIGFADKATYQTAPILYSNMSTWQQYRFGANTSTDLFSAVVIKGAVSNVPDNLVNYTINAFIYTLPGYNAQVLTFSIMIGFLIIIVAFVLAIFIYVLTIQKTSMFGVMKAQGISNAYIGWSVVAQTLIITGIGIACGMALTLISGYFLSSVVPFAVNITFYLAITAAFFVFAVLGGLFSVRAVLKIDPLKAIG